MSVVWIMDVCCVDHGSFCVDHGWFCGSQSCIDHGCFCVNNVDHRCLLFGSWMFLHRCVL